jgi:5-oxoprolinase (ATP-hydrolysing)
VIGFDMGGTSTDVSLYAGQPEVAASVEVAGLELISTTLKVHTIAAGGGSILKYENGRLQVGPESAGALPGPMSYGHGGPLTITDANLLLGRIQPAYFPAVFGTSGGESLATEPVAHAFGKVAQQINASRSDAYTPERAAQGFIRIAVENMANAIRQVSTQRGLNPSEFVLCCFGGAAGQHACELADTLGIREILIDPYAGVLSAWGIGHAQLSTYRQAAIEEILSPAALQRAATMRQKLAAQCRGELRAQQQPEHQLHTEAWLDLQRAGSDTTLSLPWRSDAKIEQEFYAEHRARFGFSAKGDAIKIVSLRVEVASQPATIERNIVSHTPDSDTHVGKAAQTQCTDGTKPETARVFCHDQWLEVPVFARNSLAPGESLTGPALVVEANSTTWLDPDWCMTVNSAQQLVISRIGHASANAEASEAFEPDPVMLEIYNRRFMHIASLMGTVLEKTAHSVNIKERLDFSCAIFDAAGNLLANAPHIPVHLGSMDETIRHLISTHRNALERGDCFAANAPYKGGTHLPDITVMSPLVDEQQQLQFIVASRAHHADIGGISPGSMPPLSQSINEEGVVFDNVRIVTDENFLERDVRNRLANSPWPARNPDQNIADLKAQLAANERGLELLRKLLETNRAETKRYCRFLLDNAAENVRHAITRLSDGEFCYPLDNGQEIRVAVAIDHHEGTASIDFTGTSPALDNNFNAPTAVCQAAIMYVFRTLVDVDIPLNSGCKRPLRVIIPEGCMLSPSYPAAVVGGNVETSQCITDALFGALGVLAGSQGTMNNLSFGNDNYQYYETICGGAGAGPTFAGESAVQTHMTNSRITDPEVIETRFPILLREFSVRQDSGGRGKYSGGNGVVRKLEFRATMHAAILSNHRLVRPFGLAGGEPGQSGKNWLVRAGGETESFAGILATTVHSGDMLVIETPGGGGYGPPDAT